MSRPDRTGHLEPDLLEAYVLGLGDPAATARLERHVAQCSACAALLAAEARREAALQAFVPRLARPEPAARAPERWRSPFLLACAGALALLLVALGSADPRRSLSGAASALEAEPPTLLCLADGESASCPLPHPGDDMTPSWAGLCAAPNHCPLQSR